MVDPRRGPEGTWPSLRLGAADWAHESHPGRDSAAGAREGGEDCASTSSILREAGDSVHAGGGNPTRSVDAGRGFPVHRVPGPGPRVDRAARDRGAAPFPADRDRLSANLRRPGARCPAPAIDLSAPSPLLLAETMWSEDRPGGSRG